MKKYLLVLACVLLVSVTGCFEDTGNDEGTAVLKVEVSVAKKLIGYPKVGEAWDTATDGKWHYPAVNDQMAAEDIPESEFGSKKIYVYMYSKLEEGTKDIVPVRTGETDTNDSTVTISNIPAGEYYVVVFYDYCYNTKVENKLNHYDRYAFYINDSEGYDKAPYSTPFYDKASKVKIEDGKTVSISVKAKKDWLLGKPAKGEGRFFLKDGDPIPTED